MIKTDGVDSFTYTIRRVFVDRVKAIDWEYKVIKKFIKHPLCLNKGVRKGVYGDGVWLKNRTTKLNNIDENGLNSNQRGAIKIREVKLNDIDENGLNAFQRAGIKMTETSKLEPVKLRRSEISKHTQTLPHVKASIQKRLALNNPMNSEETRKKLSISKKKWYETHDSPNKGNIYSDERRLQISEAQMGEKNNAYNTVWCNNGIIDKRFAHGLIPDGFVIGRIKWGKGRKREIEAAARKLEKSQKLNNPQKHP